MKFKGYYVSRKYILTWVLFIIAQVFKYMGKIDDSWWAMVSVGSIIGYGALNVFQKKVEIDGYNKSPCK
jgi:hypothetical protein